ncbi:MAG: hypothetical protein U0V48_04685 [Anaerolineales bacterium]
MCFPCLGQLIVTGPAILLAVILQAALHPYPTWVSGEEHLDTILSNLLTMAMGLLYPCNSR